MRIVSPQLGLSPKSVLGGEVFDREILLGLAKADIEVEIILPKGKPHDQKIKNWKINYLPVSHFPPQLFNFLILPYLFKINCQSKIDILRLHQPQFTGLAAIFFKLINHKVKIVASYHQFKETNFGPFSKIINNLWDHTICDSEAVKQKIITNFKVSPSKITVVKNGVPSYLKPLPKDKSLVKKFDLGGKMVLLSMGLFIDRKNPLFLIDVLSKLDKNVVLLFLGSGPLAGEIIKKAKNQGLSARIKIIDPVFGPEKNRIHSLADIFVHPAIDEGFALAPLEAMACAKPVVMTNGYSAREAVTDGENGFLCQPNNLGDWSGKLVKLINDRDLRKKMGASAFKKSKADFRWDIAVKKHVGVIKNLIR